MTSLHGKGGRRLFLHHALTLTDSIEINIRRAEQKVVVVDRCTPFGLDDLQVFITLAESDRLRGTNRGAGRSLAVAATVATQITLNSVMILGVITHRAIGAGHDAFTTAGALRLVNADNAGIRIFGDGLGIYRTRAQAGRTFTVLTGQREKIERRAIGISKPYDAVAVFARSKPVLGLASGFTALASDAMRSDATSKSRGRRQRNLQKKLRRRRARSDRTENPTRAAYALFATRPTIRHQACMLDTDPREPIKLDSLAASFW